MLDVLNNFMKNLFTVKSSDCNTYELLGHIAGSVGISVSEVAP